MVASRIDNAIAQLLLGLSGGPLGLRLEGDEHKVLQLLRYRRGAAHVIPIRDLEQKTGLTPRQIKQAVRSLRLSYRLPIGSSKSVAGGGYYVMISAEDRAIWRRDITDQIRAEVQVLRAADSDRAALEVLGQLSLEVQK